MRVGGGEAVLRFRITRFSGEVGRANMIELGWKNPHADRYWLWMSNRSLPDCYKDSK